MTSVIPQLRSPRILVAITAVILVASAGIAGWHYLYPPPTVSAPYLASLFEIRKLIGNPRTAVYSRFDSDPEATVHLRRDGDYEVTGWVEEENEHGNRVRRDWRCVVHPEGGTNWLPVYVHLDQFTAGTYVPDSK